MSLKKFIFEDELLNIYVKEEVDDLFLDVVVLIVFVLEFTSFVFSGSVC